MNILLKFKDKHTVKVYLHDTDVMHRWFMHCRKIHGKYGYRNNQALAAIDTGKQHGDDKLSLTSGDESKASKVYDILIDTLSELEKLNLSPNFEVPDNFTNDQQVLNNLHRYFTDNAKSYQNDSVVFGLVSKINYCVHELEDFTKDRNNGYVSDMWLHVSRYPIPMDCWFDFTLPERKQNYTFFDYDYKYTVRLDRSILGKCVLQSYEENDDPNASDCTGRDGSFGGFFIDTDQKLKTLYQSESFIQWANSHGKKVSDLPLEFVIGYADDFSDDPATYQTKVLEDMEFNVVPSSIG